MCTSSPLHLGAFGRCSTRRESCPAGANGGKSGGRRGSKKRKTHLRTLLTDRHPPIPLSDVMTYNAYSRNLIISNSFLCVPIISNVYQLFPMCTNYFQCVPIISRYATNISDANSAARQAAGLKV